MFEIISLIITVVLGLPSLIIFLKQKKTRLVYLENKQINVQEDLLKNFDNISISYNGQEINSNLIFIRGFIICDGDKDITSKNNFIEIISSSNSNWTDFKIISKSKGLTETSTIKENIATINFDLFKSQENFEFEGIIEKSENVKIEDIKLKFFHRIPNIDKIEILKAEDLKNLKYSFMISTILLLFGLFILNTQYQIKSHNILVYDAKTRNEIKSNDILYSDNLQTKIDSLNNETNGIYLIFSASKKYDIIYDKYNFNSLNSKKEKKTIFFKKEVSFENIFTLFIALIFLIFSTSFYLLFFHYYSKKKYLKYISTIN
ncbi:hypothetical protein SAMN05421741_102180 [Paenimyroides ummariense]|uniref:Uncharacterized protein n=1 Tax=Paenimyroides ummariense TaxID=913024 RepID=A0A1I4X960_9FLAO|nr:hypothetical protein [Paenimyroides ummariense]SFN22182.1 hypothetical protein SAMN05421741_102180 [Paenimyroides ummariense]